MHTGNADYGCFINPQKTLTNFEVKIHGESVSRIAVENKNNLGCVHTLFVTQLDVYLIHFIRISLVWPIDKHPNS
ncbi:hypothetical protein K493DRAFT_87259 [Basidiobolus meristosporus CBS 931.73]|uniref:Uncharacterized protein n=1 Tax=Basidiobolus meristosporus CBS 931.73 TaxID=1314790 RepID=A0A1Y1YVY6_9FUNG|nr:hypothetical protein K493DRAFT_87259 [Basidiobolus meristosporus CBS 931.73]|eukprot:ORY02119.1 hypothetical protein K493DRAFT_87259 [Basidiobolus meristosporus CBS 931.73]